MEFYILNQLIDIKNLLVLLVKQQNLDPNSKIVLGEIIERDNKLHNPIYHEDK